MRTEVSEHFGLHTVQTCDQAIRTIRPETAELVVSDWLTQPLFDLRAVRAAQCQLRPVFQDEREVTVRDGTEFADV